MAEPRTDRHSPDSLDIFEVQRGRLLSLAYRMLGSHAEAEDVVQEAWLKWCASDTAGLRQPAAWLTTVVTRLSIDRLRALRTERLARQSGTLPAPWIDALVPSPEARVLDRAQLSYGLILLLERLSPDERAAFLLREAFDCDYATIGAAIGKPEGHCRQIVHRAKARLARAGAPPKSADPARQRRVVDQLRAAIGAQDHAALLDALNGARVIGDAPEPVLASAWAETVSMGSEAGIVLVADGDIVALWMPWFDARGRLTLHIVTQAAALATVNRMVGRAAIERMLARIFRNARSGARHQFA
ncbi:sigma-70 family RNA polymerase sigma factor [Burkholderia sp. Ac-20353]|uniref:sigma-70 family RNA polymerase sigma factor n=1 Tax=Burkholderia sp. Ac-20353 TaxID=2703894 RepID=UPI00197C6C94|nr:sigma-70 family RNA polymerase sigma factor [Burkholderia sp. Ac-20353]MBN3791112.1 sigma-70 family RNA polymerase sigma factor [Burkholderia sp. Ac-20353]